MPDTCPVCGTAIAACCTATVLLRNTQAPPQTTATEAASVTQLRVAGGSSKGSKALKPYTQDFLTFWSAYPLKKDKATAARAFAVAVRNGAEPQTITAAAAKYADDPHRKPDFTKYPATWLNAHGWEDEDAVAADPPRRRSEQLIYGSPEWKAANPS